MIIIASQLECGIGQSNPATERRPSVRLDLPFRWLNFSVSGARHCGTQVLTLEIHRNDMPLVLPFGCASDNPNGFRWIQMDTWCGQV